MGWIDRDYSKPDKRDLGRSLLNILTSSVSLGQWFGIEVRVHASLILLVVCNVLFAESSGGLGMRNALASSAVLFGVVLLHEFGHCYAARLVGGRAHHILLWPLGGLATVDHPQRPWPSFVTAAGGPAVNVLICVLTGLGLKIMSGFQFALPLSPFLAFSSGRELSQVNSFVLVYSSTLAYYLWWIYSVSLSLLFFNLLPLFPLDGGRIFQTILWPKFGFYNSMNFACLVGMVGAGLLMASALLGNLFAFFIGLWAFMQCYQTRMNLAELSQQAWEDSQYMPSGYSVPRPTRTVRSKRRRRDDDFSWRDLNPFERMARARRKKQFARLFEEDNKDFKA